MRVLLLGSGGRESALAWALDRSTVVSELVAAPGNPGIGERAELAAIDPSDPSAVVDLSNKIDADLVVVGPEAPLVAGVADALRAEGRNVFGPSSEAARIEGSKSFAKELMGKAGVPTARWSSFTDPAPAVGYLDDLGPPYVIKADGLAAGKGVVVTSDRREAVAAVEERMVDRVFGEAGRTVVVEEYLDGEEVSLIAFCDGTTAVPCEPAQDYKRVADGDRGPNTGGMGSYSPVPSCPAPLAQQITAEVIEPVVAATRRAGAPFVGALYAGMVLTTEGPKVLEFNVRFGDPETQALIPRLVSDFGEVCVACSTGELAGLKLDWSPDACVTVILASRGYPGAHETGFPIEGVSAAAASEDVQIFHAGTSIRDGRLMTAGGRVLAVSGTGATFSAARTRAYEAARVILFEGKQYRSDIAARAEDLEEAGW